MLGICLVSFVLMPLLCQAALPALKKQSIVDNGDHVLICNQQPIELGIVLDASSSINDQDFGAAKSFLQDFVKQYNVDGGYVRVSLIVYGNGVYTQDAFNLGTYKRLDDIVAAIGAIRHRYGGRTDTGKGIKYMYQSQLANHLTRPNVPKVCVVLTDGNSQDEDITKQEAEIARNQNITMYAIGVGPTVKERELLNIAGDKSRVSRVDKYAELSQIKQELAYKTCEKVEKPTTTPPPQDEGCGVINPSDIYFVFSPASLGLDLTSWTTSFISTTINAEDLKEGFRFGVISGSCPDDAGFDLDDYNNVADIRKRLDAYDRTRIPALLQRLKTDAYTPSRGGRETASKVAVITLTSGDLKDKKTEKRIQELKAQGIKLFVTDPTNSGIKIDGVTTLTGSSASMQANDFIGQLCSK
ncbi:cuticlin-6-like isoform X2 [Physella acuta]|uniref:cuticlin-6-like isoform X2 n=1 Tax=Physella acuta TaxID=109671 RepID=UPI0027DE7D03|nr:cuticlin-6-like isoform X2 [Physella acuta]